MSYPILFDNDFIDSLPPLNVFYNPSVVMICRHLHSYREQIEHWFTNLPEQEKPDMYARLRSQDDIFQVAALYELFIHQYCWSKQWRITKNPLVDNLTPDYLIEAPNLQSFYLEVATVFEPPAIAKPKQIMNDLLHRLNILPIEYILSVHLQSYPIDQIGPGKIAQKIKQVLMSVEQPASTQPIVMDLNTYGVDGSISAFYRTGSNGGRIAVFTPPIGEGLPTFQTITRAIKKKSNKYKNLDLPFIVAICATSSLPLNEHTLNTVLYGDEVIMFEDGADNPIIRRDTKGLLTPKAGSPKPFNTKISVVLFCDRQRENESMMTILKCFHNPWAKNNTESSLFSDIPQLAQIPSSPGTVALKWIEGDNRLPVL